MPELKVLSVQSFKSPTIGGDLATIRFVVFNNGATLIRKRILSKEDNIEDHRKIYSKLGWNLFECEMGFKLGTLANIWYNLNKVLVDSKVPRENIVR